MQLAHEVHHGLAVGRVEVAGRLVRQHEQRVAGHRPRHGNALLLTAGELRRIVFCPVRHPHLLQGFVDPLLALDAGHPTVCQRQFDVLVYGEIADQVESLEDETDLPVADVGSLRRRQSHRRFTVQQVRALGG